MDLETLLALVADGGDESMGQLNGFLAEYSDLAGYRDSADAKIAEMQALNADLSTQIATVKAHNYDLLAAQAASQQVDSEPTNDDDEQDELPSLDELLKGE